ncbi:MAG: hypothetical protein B7Y90_02160 [Alphaproteobacteria bacterium 32-64-14]|nr:MAG: hypothetical protein B7Y90_02160 [Alphaproteobacteria bacterium 32-64-14]
MKFHRAIALAMTLYALGACAATKLAPGDVRVLPYYSLDPPTWPDSHRVVGFAQAIADAPDGRPVKLLTIHGMVASKSDFSDEWQANIAKPLGLVADTTRTSVDMFRGYEAQLVFGPAPVGETTPQMTSRLTRTVWREPANGEPKLIVYALLWAPIRDDLKYRFFACFESRSEPTDRGHSEKPWTCPETPAARNTGSRAVINGGLKDSLMVRGFADAVIVNGALGDILRDDLALATCVMAFDTVANQKSLAAAPKMALQTSTMDRYKTQRCKPEELDKDVGLLSSGGNLEYFVLTHSLGSYYFLESQMRAHFLDPDDQLSNIQFQMFDRATVFMFANQISLLSLANLRSYCMPHPVQGTSNPACPNFRLQPVESWKPNGGGAMTDYVAFNDPDDILGFELPPHLADVNLGRYINVTVQNPAFTVPFLFRDPGGVHTSQQNNPAIIDALVNGITVKKPPGS